jgi:hypothetical protein
MLETESALDVAVDGAAVNRAAPVFQEHADWPSAERASRAWLAFRHATGAAVLALIDGQAGIARRCTWCNRRPSPA